MSQSPQSVQPKPKPFVPGVLIPTVFVFLVLVTIQFVIIGDLPLWNFLQTTPGGGQTTPLGNSVAGQTGFSFIYLGVSIALVFGLVAVLKRHKIKDEMFYVVAIAFLIAAVAVVAAVFYYISFDIVLVSVGFVWVLYISAAAGAIPKFLTLPFIVSFATLSGVVLALALPPITAIIVPIIFACWDLYAVFRGPMTKLATALLGMQKFRYLFVAKIGAIHLGLADLVFYSMVVSFATLFGLNVGAQVLAFVMGGFFFTMWILSGGRHHALPALPIPIFLGMFGFLLAYLGIVIP